MAWLTLLLIAITATAGCDIQAIDYAVGDIKLVEKKQVVVGEQPAIKLVIENTGKQEVSDIVVTIKAKKEQLDLEEVKVRLDLLKAGERVERIAIFRHIVSHRDYELLTYAVAFTADEPKEPK